MSTYMSENNVIVVYLVVVVKNLAWLLTLLFSSAINYLVQVIPLWKDIFISVRDIGSVVVIFLVIYKLTLEIIKLKKK